MNDDAEELQVIVARLNSETARIAWYELERHYARGVLVTVDPELDLVMTAAHMVRDDKAIIEACMESGKLHQTTDDEARAWSGRDAALWAVVVAPWVLVQERENKRADLLESDVKKAD